MPSSDFSREGGALVGGRLAARRWPPGTTIIEKGPGGVPLWLDEQMDFGRTNKGDCFPLAPLDGPWRRHLALNNTESWRLKSMRFNFLILFGLGLSNWLTGVVTYTARS